jgi:putative hydrolase of the HAD superfamily
MSTRRRALILDVGGVLVRSGPRDARRAWEFRHGRTTGFLDDALREAVGGGWAEGRDEDAIRRRLVELTGIEAAEYPDLLELLDAHHVLDSELVNLVKSLRPRVRTAVLTNAGPTRRSDLVRRYQMDQLVDLIVVSAEEGISKPDVRLYLLTAERLGVDPTACVFVDDMPENVAGAERTGMTGVLYTGSRDLAHRLMILGWSAGCQSA